MAEPGSSSRGPPRKRGRREPRKVRLQFKAPGKTSCEVWVYDFWLNSSEYFEAKFDRWTSSNEEIEPIVLDLPAECQPEKGARIFRKRLFAAELEEEVKWDSVQWWRMANGDEETLFVALWVFDLILMKEYCCEVAETLRIFRVDCSNQFGPLAAMYSDNILCVQSDPLPLEEAGPKVAVGPEALQAVTLQLCHGSEAAKRLMDRAIAGQYVGPELLWKYLVNVYLFRCESEMSSWAWQRLAKIFSAGPSFSPACLKHFLRVWKRNLTNTLPDNRSLRIKLATLTADTLHLLLKESGRRYVSGDRQNEILSAIDLVMEFGLEGAEETEGLEGLLQDFGDSFKPKISSPILAIASKTAQKSVLMALGTDVARVVRGNVRLMHPELRELVLPYLGELSADDTAFLTTASFRCTESPEAPE